MITKKLYPAKDGWTIAELTMNSSAVVSAQQVKDFLGCGHAADHEWSPVEQHGKRVRVAFRTARTEVAA